MHNFGFVKKIRSAKAKELKRKHTSAFLVLDTLAENAKRDVEDHNGHALLELGEGIVTSEECGLSPQQFQTAIKYLVYNNYISVIHRGRKDKESKILSRSYTQKTCDERILQPESTHTSILLNPRINGTVLKLLDSSIYDINIIDTPNHIPNQNQINSYKSPHKEEIKEIKKEKEEHTHMEIQKVVGGCDVIIPFNRFSKSDNEFKKPQFSEGVSDNIRYVHDNQRLAENKIIFCQQEKKVQLKQKFGKEEKVKLTSEQHKALLTQMSQSEFDYWVEQIELQIGKEGEEQFRHKNKSDYHVISHWKQYRKETGKSIPKFDKKSCQKENIEFSQRAEKCLQSKYFTMVVLPSYVEFVPRNGSSNVESISYDHKDFKEQIQIMMRKKDFKKI